MLGQSYPLRMRFSPPSAGLLSTPEAAAQQQALPAPTTALSTAPTASSPQTPPSSAHGAPPRVGGVTIDCHFAVPPPEWVGPPPSARGARAASPARCDPRPSGGARASAGACVSVRAPASAGAAPAPSAAAPQPPPGFPGTALAEERIGRPPAAPRSAGAGPRSRRGQAGGWRADR